MQQARECWETSSCHSFCSTNEQHFRYVDINDEELDFEADHAELELFLPKPPSRPKEIPKRCETLPDTSSEVEEGEIKDSSDVEDCDDSHICRFFEKGSCAFGGDCRFLHNSDKGLYNMFGCHRPVSRNVCGRLRLPVKPELPRSLPEAPQEVDNDWDRELEEAMLRVRQSRKKVPFCEKRSTIQSPKALPTSPIPEDKTYARRVRYRGEEEQRMIASKQRKSQIGSETDRQKSSRSNKRRRSETSRSRSRSLSAKRRFSCKCCQTPSPGYRHVSSRRPICCYRRKSISSSSSSPSPVSRRRVRDVADYPRRKRRGRSPESSPDGYKIRKYTSAAQESQNSGSVPLSTRKCRDSKTLAPSRSSKPKCSSDKITVQATKSLAKVDKPTASPDRSLSDMSISPLPSDRDSENVSNNVRCPSDMSISPFSESPSPDRFSVSVRRAEKPRSVVAIPNSPAGPRKVQKPEGSSPKKRVKRDIPEEKNLHIALPQLPISKSCAPKNRFRNEVEELQPYAVPSKDPKYVGSVVKMRLKSGIAGPKPPAVQLEEPISEHSVLKRILPRIVAEPEPSAVPRKVPKTIGSALKMRLKSDIVEPKPPAVQREVPKSEISASKKRYQSDAAESKSIAVLQDKTKHGGSSPKKKLKNVVAEPKMSTIPRQVPKSGSSAPKKIFQSDDAGTKPKERNIPKEIRKFLGSNAKKKVRNDVAEPNPPTTLREVLKPESSAPKKIFNHLLLDLMKFHKKMDPVNVAVKTEVSCLPERREETVTKFEQKSSSHSLSKKERLLMQLRDVNAAIERKKALANQNP